MAKRNMKVRLRMVKSNLAHPTPKRKPKRKQQFPRVPQARLLQSRNLPTKPVSLDKRGKRGFPITERTKVFPSVRPLMLGTSLIGGRNF